MFPSAARAASSARPAEKEEMIRFAGLTIDTLGHVLYVDGEKTELTAKEYDILLYLVNNRGIVLTRDKY
jgi:DNA-binding response OmpR family regulator